MTDGAFHEIDADAGPALFYLGDDGTMYRLDQTLSLNMNDDGTYELAHADDREQAICVALLNLAHDRLTRPPS